MPLQPRPEIENLQVCPHGGINYAELSAMGITPEAVLDFSVCTNPFMPPPGIGEMLNNIAIDKYPDCEATELRQRLSERLGVPPDYILVGSGTTELIRLIALAYFRRGDRIGAVRYWTAAWIRNLKAEHAVSRPWFPLLFRYLFGRRG